MKVVFDIQTFHGYVLATNAVNRASISGFIYYLVRDVHEIIHRLSIDQVALFNEVVEFRKVSTLCTEVVAIVLHGVVYQFVPAGKRKNDPTIVILNIVLFEVVVR